MNRSTKSKVQSSLSFSDLFDLNEIQELQDAFSAATGVASIITDPVGKPITNPSGFCSLCSDVIRKTERGLSNCQLSDATLGSPDLGGPKIQHCMSGGLMDCGASIVVDGRHVANWMIGQILNEESSEEELILYADQIGADRELYLRELRKVKRMSAQHFRDICEFLFINAKMLSKYAYKNQKLERKVAERTLSLEKKNHELVELNAVLEEEVAQREKSEQLVTELNLELESRVHLRTRQLTDSELLYSTTFQQCPTAIEIFDEEGTFISANDACFKIIGIDDVSDLKDLRLFTNPNISDDMKSRLLKQESVQFESDFDFALVPYKSKYLGNRTFDWRLAPIIHENITTGYIVQVQDITDQKSAHREILKAKDAAESANLSKTQFLANMSHEIRTPMNGIIGFTELALMTPLNAQQRDYITIVKTSTQSLLHVVNDILDYSKMESGNVTLHHQPFELRRVVKEVADLFSISAQQKSLYIKVNTDERIPTTVVGDSVRLKQVLLNLVGNAVKFTPCGGITIGVSVEKVMENRTCVGFQVTDTGIGITSEEIKNLFQRFYQVESSHKRTYGGSGLGLVISKNLVEMMDGELEVSSQYGLGSTFKFSAVFPAG